MSTPLQALEHALGHVFLRSDLLVTALTHSSWANERGDAMRHNERLEFLGDAVLELCVTEVLFARFPDAPEGELTQLRSQLVNETSLAELARKLSLDVYVLVGKGEENQGGRERPALLSDVFEAVIGAIFLDAGYEAARAVLSRIFDPVWPAKPAAPKPKDYKSRLQEYTQKVHKARPVYTLLGSDGPEHDKLFQVRLTLPDGQEVTAIEKSVKKAEQMAAKLALMTVHALDEAS